MKNKRGVAKILKIKIIKRGIGISGVIGKNSNVVINVAYSKLKLQLHITFLLLSQLTFRKINKREGGGGIRAGGGVEKFGIFNKRGGTLIW